MKSLVPKLIDIVKKNYVYLITVFLTLLLLLIYFMSSASLDDLNQNTTVKIHFADNISEAHKEVIEEFNEIYKGKIEVVPIDLPFTKFSTNERKELLARSLRSKSERLDIFAVDHIWVERFVKWSEPLENYFDVQMQAKILPEALETCKSNGHIYSFPLYLDIGTMHYREDLLKEFVNDKKLIAKLDSSITWEDFIAMSKYFDSGRNPFYTFPAADYEGLICSFTEAILNQNRNFFDENSFDLTKPEAANALNLLVDLIHKYKITSKEVTSFKEIDAFTFFRKNNGVFIRDWPVLEFNINQYEVLRNNVKKAPLPHFRNTHPAYIFGGWNLMISKYSKHKKEALVFINFTLNRKSQMKMYEIGGYLPVLSEVYNDPEIIAANPDITFFKRLIEDGVHRPSTPDYTRISDITSHFVNKALQKQLPVESALEQAAKYINEGKVIIK
ncbi:MAG: extracellular solute-binding protein [Melioribacteraceae bacterium]|nr:extracellular solute-binding protein [Melioribacteraceae bacterium]MCF8356936.1 extracellular solute-binding protein [Melioribacteraceae bacterium]MCF8396357.1 extracellular solute-binding protein [Melioribacteraceae bacterium]MCF8421199.1 extracellular solute-binding protein [Melioribacteraceae bacterium]